MNKVRTRFAPSPTGFLHIGGLRTALYAYAQAKANNGDFVLRIEDTDRKRYVEGAVDKLIKMLKTFGINWDEGPEVGGPYQPYIQSERVKTGIYKEYAEKLIKDGHAYYCFCKEKTKEEIKKEHDDKKIEIRDVCRGLDLDESIKRVESGEKGAVRLKVPENEVVSYFDSIREKEISWNTNFVDDAMLLKSDGYPAYHLSVVVDDVEMGITHISRAHEWLPSTPIHILLYKYLGKKLPEIGHFTAILDPEGGKLSKRKGSVSCEDFLSRGYLPEAILNFIMLLGWAPKDNKEMFSLQEFVKAFNSGNLQVSNPIFNIDKLDWFNGQYIRNMSDSSLKDQFLNFDGRLGKLNEKTQMAITKLIKDRVKRLDEIRSLAGFFFEAPSVDKSLFLPEYIEHLKSALKVVSNLENWEIDSLNNNLMSEIKDKGYKVGDFFMTLRIAITGSKFTPPINDSIIILGRDEVVSRIGKLI